MAKTNELGKLGESLAQQYLIEKGYAILATNWRIGRNEADIIAYFEGLIVFVEVKTRTASDISKPEDAVTLSKQKAYIKLANAYVIENNRPEEVRFDIITVTHHTLSDIRINHFINAFTTVG